MTDKIRIVFVYASVLFICGVVLLATSIYVYNKNDTCNPYSCGNILNCRNQSCNNCTKCFDKKNNKCISFTEECTYDRTLFIVTFIFGIVCTCLSLAVCASISKRRRELVETNLYQTL